MRSYVPRSFASQAQALRFNQRFLACLITGLALLATVPVALHRAQRLPPPPLTGTSCIDSKLAFLRTRELSRVNFLVVGSSVAWHGVNVSALTSKLPGIEPLNAAPCYLYVDQTEWFTSFLIQDMPSVHTVLAVFSPRDFAHCDPSQTELFDRALARSVVMGKQNPWLVYLQGLSSSRFVNDAIKLRLDPRKMDRFGTSPLRIKRHIGMEKQLDERCFQALRKLEATTSRQGVRLVVATQPLMPAWSRVHDPDGAFADRWHARIESSLRSETTVFVDGRQLPLPDGAFADSLHLLWPSTASFSHFIANGLSGRQIG